MFIGYDLSVPGVAVSAAQTVAAVAGTDEFINNVFLLMGFDDQADTSTVLTQEALWGPWGINPWNTFEAKGDAQVDTGSPLVDNGSLLMTAAGTGWVVNQPPVQLFSAASSPFTWQGRAKVSNTVTTELFSVYVAATGTRVLRVLVNASGKLVFIVYATNGGSTPRLTVTATSTSVPNNTLFEWAVERQADGTVTLYVDGTADTTTGSFTGEIGPVVASCRINALVGTAPGSGQQDYTADEFRFTEGVARYGGANYTVDLAAKWPRPTAHAASGNEEWFTASGADTFTVPAGVSSITVEAWGGGGGGATNADGGAGGGGGEYAKKVVSVTPESTINLSVGAGGAPSTAGGDTTFDTTVVVAKGGGAASGSVGGSGGTGGTGDTTRAGGSAETVGGIGVNGGGGGGSAASDAAVGNTGLRNDTGSLSSGGRGGREATYTNFPGGAGGNGGALDHDGGKGQFPGGGGGGSGGNSAVDYGFGAEVAGAGADGAIRITW